MNIKLGIPFKPWQGKIEAAIEEDKNYTITISTWHNSKNIIASGKDILLTKYDILYIFFDEPIPQEILKCLQGYE